MISAEKTEILLFRLNWPDDHELREKIEITFFRENWPEDHGLDGKKPRLQNFMKIDPTTMINAENTEILFFR
jgi:hypothetical protein